MATLAVSFAAIFVRLAGDDPETIVWLRMGMATVLLAPWALRSMSRAKSGRIAPRQVALVLASGSLLGAHFLLWTASLGLTSIAASVLLVSLHPLLVVPAGKLLLRDTVPSRAAAGAAIALSGTAVTCFPGFTLGGSARLGDLLALGGAVCLAGYLLIGRSVRNRTSTVTYSASVYAIVCMVGAGAAFVGGTAHMPTPRVALLCLALAVVCTLGGHTVYNSLLRRVPAAIVSAAFLAEPPLTALLAIVILGSLPSPLTVAGGILILTGLALALPHPASGYPSSPIADLE